MAAVPSTPATVDAGRRGVNHRVSVIGPVSNVEEAAAARGVAVGALIKSIVVRRSDNDYLFVLVPGDRAIDWAKLRAVLGVSRLSLPNADEALAVTGYVRGTITPFGSTSPWPVVMDSSFAEYDEVAIGGGGSGVGILLAPDTLAETFQARVDDVTKVLDL